MTEPVPTKRRPYTGSCGCGAVKYIAFFALPATPLPPPKDPRNEPPRQRFYRCSCTTCTKAGFFHALTADAPNDFLLLSPLSPFADLADFTANAHAFHWLFCRHCGGRCFLAFGEGVVEERDLAALGVPGFEPGVLTKVWHTLQPNCLRRIDGKFVGNHLSINAWTLDPGQEGLDLEACMERD